MNGTRRQLIYDAAPAIDVAMAGVCLFVAVVFTNQAEQFSNLTKLVSLRISVRNLIILFCLAFVWHLIFKQMGFYLSRRLIRLRQVWDIVKGITVITGVLLVVQIFHPMQVIKMVTLEVFWFISLILFILSRVIFQLFLSRARRKGRISPTILIVGTNARAIKYARKLNHHHLYGYQVAGFVDTHWNGPRHDNYEWCRLVADFKNFPEYLRTHVIDEVYIFLPLRGWYDAIEEVIAACEQQGVTIRIALDFFNLRIAQWRIEKIELDPMLTLFTGAMQGESVIIKAFTDRILAGILLLLFLPLFVCVALAIKFTSPGPVFFRQKRLGYNKRIFKIFKFRTMVLGAEAMQKDLEHLNEMGVEAGAFKIKNDPRATPFGKFLRKYSIDELPQLINVLKGEMSFVGPRPLTERDFTMFRIHHQARRFTVKPGITCLWQVSGRNVTTFNRMVELDTQYIDEWSLALDLKILLRTIPAVFTGHGAS
jgi:exopolysaccharide biosynthesis polyprenyl glycosylphosphotransferase